MPPAGVELSAIEPPRQRLTDEPVAGEAVTVGGALLVTASLTGTVQKPSLTFTVYTYVPAAVGFAVVFCVVVVPSPLPVVLEDQT